MEHDGIISSSKRKKKFIQFIVQINVTMKKDEIILEGLGDSIGNEFTDLINIRVADIAFPARKTGYIR